MPKISEINFRELDQKINSNFIKRKNDRQFKKAMADYQNRNTLIRNYKKVFGLNVLPGNKAVV